jgi:hypothetical protein
MNTPTSERRRFQRVNFFTDAWLCDSNGRQTCQVHDLSLKGALVAVPEGNLASLVTPITLEIHLCDSDDMLRMEVSVMHEREGVYGLLCERIDVDSMTHLRRLVELNLGETSLLERELNALVA